MGRSSCLNGEGSHPNSGGSLRRERSRAAGLGAGRMVSPQCAQTAARACETSSRQVEAEDRAKHRWSSSSGLWKPEAKSEFRRRKRSGLARVGVDNEASSTSSFYCKRSWTSAQTYSVAISPSLRAVESFERSMFSSRTTYCLSLIHI